MWLRQAAQHYPPVGGINHTAADSTWNHAAWVMTADQKLRCIEAGGIGVNRGIEFAKLRRAVIRDINPDDGLGAGGTDDQCVSHTVDQMDVPKSGLAMTPIRASLRSKWETWRKCSTGLRRRSVRPRGKAGQSTVPRLSNASDRSTRY